MKSSICLPGNIVISKVNQHKLIMVITIVGISVILMVLASVIQYNGNSNIPIALGSISIIGIITASVMLCTLKQNVLTTSLSPLQTILIEFPASQYSLIVAAISDCKWHELRHLIKTGNGAIMQLEIVHSKDGNFAAYQFFHYIPHTYEPCSDITYINREDIEQLACFNQSLIN